MTALDILRNGQSDYGLAVTVAGREYVDKALYGATGADRITTPLTITRAIGGAFEPSITDTIGSIRLANTENAPLRQEFLTSYRDEEVTIDVYGLINRGLFGERAIYYQNRQRLMTARLNGVSYGNNGFLLSLGSGSTALDVDLLDEVVLSSSGVVADDINFTTLSPTSVQSNSQIGITASISGDDITLDFSEQIGKLELSVEGVGDTTTHTDFNFTSISTNVLRSDESLGIEIEIDDLSPNFRDVTLRFDKPISRLRWLMRQIFGNVVNYSIQPVSIDHTGNDNLRDTPEEGNINGAFPNTDGDSLNSVITWDNLPQGTTEISFRVTGAAPNGSLTPDEGGRAFTNDLKMWLVEAVESIDIASNLTLSANADEAPSDNGAGFYSFTDLGSDELVFSADFGGDVTVTPLDNTIKFESELASITLIVESVDRSGSLPPATALRPLSFGNLLHNVSPIPNGGSVFDIGDNIFNVINVRENGVQLTWVNGIDAVEANTALDIPSWTYDNASERIVCSEGVENITADIRTTQFSFNQFIQILADRAGVAVRRVDNEYGNQPITIFYTEQLTVRQALDDLLSQIDGIFKLTDEGLIIESRKDFSVDDFDAEIVAANDVQGDLSIGAQLPRYHTYEAVYDRNHTVQNNVVAYRGRGETTRSNNPNLEAQVGTLSRSLVLPFDRASAANRVVNKRRRDQRRAHRVTFSTLGRQFEFDVNERIDLVTDLLPRGMFLIERVTEVTGTKRTLLDGVYYVG